MTRTHDEWRELIAAYSLDALEPSEAGEVADHLADCAECLAELRAYSAIAAQFSATDTPPPAGLWDRIADELSEEPATTMATPMSRIPTARTRPWTLWAVAAAILVIVGLSVFVVSQQRRLDTAHRNIAAQLDGQSAVERAARHTAATPGARQIALADSGGTTVADVVIGSGVQAYVIPKAMRDLPNGKTYQVWGKHGTTLISLGVLGSQPATTMLTLPPGIQAVAVTVEDSPGVVTSHNTPIAVAPVA